METRLPTGLRIELPSGVKIKLPAVYTDPHKFENYIMSILLWPDQINEIHVLTLNDDFMIYSTFFFHDQGTSKKMAIEPHKIGSQL